LPKAFADWQELSAFIGKRLRFGTKKNGFRIFRCTSGQNFFEGREIETVLRRAVLLLSKQKRPRLKPVCFWKFHSGFGESNLVLTKPALLF